MKKLVDGEIVEMNQTDIERHVLGVKSQEKEIVANKILTAPTKGFGGPTVKELFNGNR